MNRHYLGNKHLRCKKIEGDGCSFWVEFEHDIKMVDDAGKVAAEWRVGFSPDYSEVWYCGPREIPDRLAHLFNQVMENAKRGDSED